MSEIRSKWAVDFAGYCDCDDDLQAALDLTFERIESAVREDDGDTARTVLIHRDSTWCDGEEDEGGNCLCGMSHEYTNWSILETGDTTEHRVLVQWVDGRATFTVEDLPDV